MPLTRRVLMLAAGTLALGLHTVGHAQSYPTKPVRIVVPYAPGGPVDVLARALSGKLSAMWGQQVIVDNKPGGNEVIAASQVAKSPGDGYTLMLATDPTLSLNPFLFQKLSYDPLKELTPITRVAISNMALVVPAAFPANDLKEFVAYARANPDKVAYGSSGLGNGTHLALAWFAKENKMSMVHVPYKGLAPALQDMLGGNIQATVGAVSVVTPYVDSGKLKALAISGSKRARSLPNVPTFAQAGYPWMEASFYYGLIAPAGVASEVKDKIAGDIRKILADEQFRKENIDNFALDPVGDTPQEFAQFLVKDREQAAKKVQLSGARLD